MHYDDSSQHDDDEDGNDIFHYHPYERDGIFLLFRVDPFVDYGVKFMVFTHHCEYTVEACEEFFIIGEEAGFANRDIHSA